MPEVFKCAELHELVQRERPITYGIVQPGDFVLEGVPLVRGGDYSDGWSSLDQIKRVRPEIDRPYSRSRLQSGDLVVTIVGAKTGNVATVPKYLNGANITQTTARVAIDGSKADPEYVLQYFKSAIGAREVYRNIKGGAQPGLNLSDLENFRIPLPPLHVQRRITEILCTWDEAIEKTERLISVKNSTFAYWSHALLTGRNRLGRKRTKWPSVALTEAATQATTRNAVAKLGVDVVMGVNKMHGMIPMKDHVRASDLSRYKVVRPEAFAYNPMRLNIGSIAQNLHGRDVLVSPDYVAFEANPDVLMPAYFDHIRRTSIWSRFVKTAGSGGVRIRIYYDDLADFVLELPPLSEQARIVQVLNTGRREIAILEQQRDALGRQKRGLMQKLLTGEWSVNAPKSREAAA